MSLQLHQVSSKSDEKQKSFINTPFFCSEFQSVSRIVKIVHSALPTPQKNEFFSQISQQQKKSTEACTTAFSIARPLGAKYGLKWVNILLYITIYMLYDLKLPLNY